MINLSVTAKSALELGKRHTGKFFSIDRFATSAVTLGEITSLEHKFGNDTMEGGSLVSKAVLTSGEFTEVFRGLGDHIVVEFEHDTTGWLAADGDVELKNRQNKRQR